MTFEQATRVAPAGDGRFTGEIAAGWDIGGNANGGYLLAMAGRALTAVSGRPDPVTVTAHYLSPGRPGPVEVEAAVVKAGKRFTTATATMTAADRPVLTALATLGDLADASGPERLFSGPPDLPPVEECIGVRPTDTFPPPFNGKIESRLHPDDMGFGTGKKSGVPLMRGWFRLRDGEPMDAVTMLCTLDAFPPGIFNTDLPVGWVPTVELTAHVRARPPETEWLACAFSTRFVSGGFLEEDGEVWTADGHLVAQSRQLALVPRAG